MIMAVIGENTRITRGKDMEYIIMMVEIDTSGNGFRVTNTGMEYSDGQMDQYIMDKINRIKEMAMDITEMQKAKIIMDSARMTSKMEKGS
jgi:hypothetical protein